MISNKEILKRLDVLYNNIMSDRAPGLNAYEKSVFFNKAQLEVLKNHLNPKGNKYGEGFDFSSKRQLEFSGLIESCEFVFSIEDKRGQFNQSSYRFDAKELIEWKTSLVFETETIEPEDELDDPTTVATGRWEEKMKAQQI